MEGEGVNMVKKNPQRWLGVFLAMLMFISADATPRFDYKKFDKNS